MKKEMIEKSGSNFRFFKEKYNEKARLLSYTGSRALPSYLAAAFLLSINQNLAERCPGFPVYAYLHI
jgi:hypothetical protein